MIVDFVNIKKRLDRIVNLHLIGVYRGQQGLLGGIKSRGLHEGQTATYQTVDNETQDLELKRLSSKFEVTPDQIPALKISDVLNFYERMASDIVTQQEKLLIETLGETCDAAGQTVDGSDMTPSDAFLEVLRTIHIEFDEVRDRPHMPSMVMHPDTADKMRVHFEGMTPEENLAHEKEKQKILDDKFREYLLREGNRKLVD